MRGLSCTTVAVDYRPVLGRGGAFVRGAQGPVSGAPFHSVATHDDATVKEPDFEPVAITPTRENLHCRVWVVKIESAVVTRANIEEVADTRSILRKDRAKDTTCVSGVWGKQFETVEAEHMGSTELFNARLNSDEFR